MLPWGSPSASTRRSRRFPRGGCFEAEEELRRAELSAIAANLPQRLVQIHTPMGKLRGSEQDETGFVFFEQAIELCNTLERSLATEAQVYLEYGLLRERLGQRDQARAYLERAREILTHLGEVVERGRVDAELEKLSAQTIPLVVGERIALTGRIASRGGLPPRF